MSGADSTAMKRAHIVYGHPEPDSFVAAMRETVRGALAGEGWETTATDLQAAAFESVASSSDFGTRSRPDYLVYPLEQRHGYENRTLSPDILSEVDLVQNADLLVLVFPIFWYSVPAQMKGWIDRVFVSGAFYGGRRIYDRGGMKGKHALVVASLGGREHMFGPGAIHGELSGMLRHLLQGTLGYVGYSVYDPFFAYHVPYVGNSARVAMLARLEADIRAIGSRPVLPMPRLEDFDQEFRPKAKG